MSACEWRSMWTRAWFFTRTTYTPQINERTPTHKYMTSRTSYSLWWLHSCICLLRKDLCETHSIHNYQASGTFCRNRHAACVGVKKSVWRGKRMMWRVGEMCSLWCCQPMTIFGTSFFRFGFSFLSFTHLLCAFSK